MLSVRIVLYPALGALFGLGLGFGWWTVLPAAVGVAIAILATDFALVGIPLLIAVGAFLLVAITGLSPVSKTPTVFGVAVVAIIGVVELLAVMKPRTPSPTARATTSKFPASGNGAGTPREYPAPFHFLRKKSVL